MDNSLKQSISAAISAAFTVAMTADNISNENLFTIKMDEVRECCDDTADISVFVSISNAFAPVDGLMPTVAEAIFCLEFYDCEYDESNQRYQWSGKDYVMNYGHLDSNLKWGYMRSNSEYHGIGIIDDKDITSAAIKGMMNNLEPEQITSSFLAIFNVASNLLAHG